jgi:LmbE family N-acetylglucosaminyl deacetylase
MNILKNKHLILLAIILLLVPVALSIHKPAAVPVKGLAVEGAEDLWAPVTFSPNDRIMVLAPHPDDEVLGCGGVLQNAHALNLPIKVVFLTYGDMNEWAFLLYRKHFVLRPSAIRLMGMVRHDEAIKAARAFGMGPEDLFFLGYPDFGTLNLWKYYWADNDARNGVGGEPYRSLLAGARAVPYTNAYHPGSPYMADAILKDLKEIIGDFKPTKIFVSHPADHNGDHLAFYLFTRIALWDLHDTVHAQIYPYLIHYLNWPVLKGYHPDYSLEPPESLRDTALWRVNALSSEEMTGKLKALKCHRSQMISSGKYLSSFVRHNELFGDFSEGKLKRHDGKAVVGVKGQPSLNADELTDQERAAFFGIEQTAISVEGDSVVFQMRFAKRLGTEAGLRVFVFGYRPDRPFSAMPKIRVDLGIVREKVFDGRKRLPGNSIEVAHAPKQITVRVPFALLGEPDRILTSSQVYFGSLPLQVMSWRIINFREK